MSIAILGPVAEEIARALAPLDVAALRASYLAQNEFIHLERLIPETVIIPMLDEVERARGAINRNFIPRQKKGGSVSAYTLRERAPAILTLYRSPAFLAFVRAVTGAAVDPC